MSRGTTPPPPPRNAPSPPPSQNRDPTTPPPPPPVPEIGNFSTEINEFGMYRVYPTMPSREVEENEELINDPSQQDIHSKGIWAPFLNATVYKLFRWFYTGGNTKSVAELQRLVDDVLDQPDYSATDIHGLKITTVLANLDSHDPTISPFALEDGWKKSTVAIPLPCRKKSHTRQKRTALFSTFPTSTTALFLTPSNNSPPERVVSELYNSDAFYEEHVELMKCQPPPTKEAPYYEVAIAAIMLWSDSTHLANFGSASLWPIYLYLGNLSKYTRAKPTCYAANHIAYIPSLPANLQDIYMKAFNIPASKDTISHLRRELMHAVWLLLLDPEFMKAYEHGFVMECSDDVWRRIFPRFFTYSADYPEKYLAKCPCPRCTTQKKYIPALGTHADFQRRAHKRMDSGYRQFDVEAARKDIYQDGRGARSKAVKDKLDSDSSLPVRNAFSTRLFKHGFNFYDMFVPDLLHEFELGVWKAVFTHLMRILYATGANSNAIQTLNKRYRITPTFGETIRRFSNNAAAMTKLAARDFEDLLQCALPVFELLLSNPQHNKITLNLIFTLSTWHALAKLRLHTSSTLAALKAQTRELGFALREFVKAVCPEYNATALPSEEAARARRQANEAKRKGMETTTKNKRSKQAQSKRNDDNHEGEGQDENTVKVLNLFTYKLHALGDYVDAIWKYGPSDNYSTQLGESEHISSKRFYTRTNKGQGFDDLDIELATTVYELGGGAALHALAKSHHAVPSRNTLAQYRREYQLKNSIGEPTMQDFLDNIEVMFKETRCPEWAAALHGMYES
ncbi:hypothetical protein CVT24_011174 [Panaeolus cyanescens]|uniref:Uncharacterized protein n=1 Tax=Panaeolus cyanescens TaxID=181874 RepID=A0A409YGD1_9AGAR|nr:hypothetical protein CVT24_011174 [Panaeolus cyanescens]